MSMPVLHTPHLGCKSLHAAARFQHKGAISACCQQLWHPHWNQDCLLWSVHRLFCQTQQLQELHSGKRNLAHSYPLRLFWARYADHTTAGPDLAQQGRQHHSVLAKAHRCMLLAEAELILSTANALSGAGLRLHWTSLVWPLLQACINVGVLTGAKSFVTHDVAAGIWFWAPLYCLPARAPVLYVTTEVSWCCVLAGSTDL